MEFVTKVVECVNTFLWDYALLILLLGAGIIYSFSLKFIQVRKFGAGMKALFGNFSLHGGKGENGLSSFQALTTAIAAQVGTGNIAGAATAIASGGPGSIFWMWVSGTAYKKTGKRPLCRRPGILYKIRIQGQIWKIPGRFLFCSYHSGPGIYGKYGTVQLYRCSI